MGAKRALVVDDSKSARVFLSRILEKYEIDVDSAENAEAAIEYLGTNRPDVYLHGSHDAGHGRLPVPCRRSRTIRAPPLSRS